MPNRRTRLDDLLKIAIKAHGGLNAWNQFESLRAMRAIYPLFRVLFPNQVIPADDLARAMVDVAVRETGKTGGLVFENRDIRARVK